MLEVPPVYRFIPVVVPSVSRRDSVVSPSLPTCLLPPAHLSSWRHSTPVTAPTPIAVPMPETPAHDTPLDLSTSKPSSPDGPLDLSIRKPRDDRPVDRSRIGRVTPFLNNGSPAKIPRKVSPVRPHIRGVPVLCRSPPPPLKWKDEDMELYKPPMEIITPTKEIVSPTQLVVTVDTPRYDLILSDRSQSPPAVPAQASPNQPVASSTVPRQVTQLTIPRISPRARDASPKSSPRLSRKRKADESNLKSSDSVPPLISPVAAAASVAPVPVAEAWTQPGYRLHQQMSPGSTRKYLHIREQSPGRGASQRSCVRNLSETSLSGEKSLSECSNATKRIRKIGKSVNNNSASPCKAAVECATFRLEGVKLSKDSAFQPSPAIMEKLQATSQQPYFAPIKVERPVTKSKFSITQTRYFQNVMNERSRVETTTKLCQRRGDCTTPTTEIGSWEEHLVQHKKTVFKMPTKLLHVPKHTKPGFKAEIKPELLNQESQVQVHGRSSSSTSAGPSQSGKNTSCSSSGKPSSSSSALSNIDTPPVNPDEKPTEKHEKQDEKRRSLKRKRSTSFDDSREWLAFDENTGQVEDIGSDVKPMLKMFNWGASSDQSMTEEAHKHMCDIIDMVAKGCESDSEPTMSENKVQTKQEKTELESLLTEQHRPLLREKDIKREVPCRDSKLTDSRLTTAICSAIDDATNGVLEIARLAQENLVRKKRTRRKVKKNAKLNKLIASVTRSIGDDRPDYEHFSGLPPCVDNTMVSFDDTFMSHAHIKTETNKGDTCKISPRKTSCSEAEEPLTKTDPESMGDEFKDLELSPSPKKKASLQSPIKKAVEKSNLSPRKKAKLLATPVVPLPKLKSQPKSSPRFSQTLKAYLEESPKTNSGKSKPKSSPQCSRTLRTFLEKSPQKSPRKTNSSKPQGREKSPRTKSPEKSPRSATPKSSCGTPESPRSPRFKSSISTRKALAAASAEKRRKRRSLLKELENSEGYVADKRLTKETTNLYDDPKKLDREARLIQVRKQAVCFVHV